MKPSRDVAGCALIVIIDEGLDLVDQSQQTCGAICWMRPFSNPSSSRLVRVEVQ
jgi:hypothetical protein